MKNEMDQYITKMEKAEEVLGPIDELDPAVEIELGALFYISLLQGRNRLKDLLPKKRSKGFLRMRMPTRIKAS